jgi:4-amino-4-deoxy-L-arabinose transferase-like glycosyltransferase
MSINSVEKGNKYRHLLIGLLLILPGILLRFLQPQTFPAVYIDESYYNVGPKYAVLFDNPLAFTAGHIFLSPIHYLMTLFLYSLFTPSLFLSRFITALFGTGSILFVYLLGKRFADSRIAFFAALLCAYNFLLIYMSRLAILETEVTFFMLAAVYFWFHKNSRLTWISGVILGVATLTKVYAAALLLILPVAQMLDREAEPAGWISLKRMTSRHWRALFLGIAIIGLGYVFISRMSWQLFVDAWAHHTYLREGQYSPLHFVRDFVTLIPDLLILAGITLISYLKSRKNSILLIGVWLVGFVLAIETLNYRPTRFFYPAIPMLALLAAFTLSHIDTWFKARRKQVIFYALIGLLCLSQLYRLAPFYRDGKKVNRCLLQTAAWMQDHIPPGEPVIAFDEQGIITPHFVIPYQRMFLTEAGLRDSTALKYLPQTRYAVLNNLDVDLLRGKGSRVSEFLSEHNFKIVRRIGFVSIFTRADTAGLRDNFGNDTDDTTQENWAITVPHPPL